MKARVMAKHRTAVATRNPEGGWDVRAGDQLLGQGTTASGAWWDAYTAIRDAEKRPATCWPFPVSAHQEISS